MNCSPDSCSNADAPAVPRWASWVAAAVALGVVAGQLARLWPLDVHLRDDAFYYFAWARSLAAGQGPCVTDGVPTSGVHLAWAVLLSGVAALAGVASLPSIAVVLGIGLHGVAAALIARAFQAPVRGAGALAGLLYLGSAPLTNEAMNGQETALANVALAGLCAVHRRGTWWFLGGTMLVAAARSDLLLFALALALAVPGARLRRMFAFAVAIGCYALWNVWLAGTPLQDSAAPIPWLMAQERAAAGEPWVDGLCARALPTLLGTRFRTWSTPLAAAWLLAAWFGFRRGDRELAWLLAGGLGLVVVHDLWRAYPRDYYFAPLAVGGALGLIRLFAHAPRLAFGVAALALLWNIRHAADPPRLHGAQREMTMAGRLLDRFVPPGDRVGCFNAGIVTWLRPGQVVNLDGVVNRAAFDSLRKSELARYLAEHRVAWIADNPVQLAHRGVHSCGRYFGAAFSPQDLVEVARFVWPGDPGRGWRRAGTEWLGLYARDGHRSMLAATERMSDLGPAPLGDRFILWRARMGEVLRDRQGEVWRADADRVFVLQVARRGVGPWQLFAGASALPLLTLSDR